MTACVFIDATAEPEGSAAACWGLLGAGHRADRLSDRSFTSPSMLCVFLAQEVTLLLTAHSDSLDEDELSASTCHAEHPQLLFKNRRT